MNIIFKVIKGLLNLLMTIILIVGSVFVILYVIGIEPFVVESGSMSPSIEKGSISFINKHISYDDIKVNDVIAFKISTGDSVTHRVINISEAGFETKGDANEISDGNITTRLNYIGKNIFSVPKAGYFIKTLQTTKGKIILITIIIFILTAGFLLGDDKKKEDKKIGKHEA